jgi:GNAT superfamily N-acetyltransferase
VEPQASESELRIIQDGLRKFNEAYIGAPHEEPVAVFLRDDANEIVGGLMGQIKWRWLYVARLWISDTHRGKGHGSALLGAAEQYARDKGCVGSHLDTFEYQARPFYEKLGYVLWGTLEGNPPGYRQFHLAKRFSTE